MTQTLEANPRSFTKSKPPARSNPTPAVILLGGGANALSVARNLGRLGVDVYPLYEAGAFVRYSRYCCPTDAPIPLAGKEAETWAKFLLSRYSDSLAGSMLLACCDAGIELIAAHREKLSARYILDESHTPAQLAMLNKLATYQEAVAAGVPTPRFWLADSPAELADIRDSLLFPLIIKPRFSHVFEARTGKKLIIAKNFDEVAAAVATVTATGTGCMLVEMIPGPDDLLCSYFTYLDEDSNPLLHFTKRVIRRNPPIMGAACYHITDWNPEVAELGNRLFKHVGLRGVANVEFKRDLRDGQLKLIECNARFTASDALVTRSGVNLARFVYNRLTGRNQPATKPYVRGMRQWDPMRDFQAYLRLRQDGQLSFGQWLMSVMHPQSFAYWRSSDPMPGIARLLAPLRKKFASSKKRESGR